MEKVNDIKDRFGEKLSQRIEKSQAFLPELGMGKVNDIKDIFGQKLSQRIEKSQALFPTIDDINLTKKIIEGIN